MKYFLLLCFFSLAVIFSCKSKELSLTNETRQAIFINGCGPDDGRAVRVFLVKEAMNCQNNYLKMNRISTYLNVRNTSAIKVGITLKGYGYHAGGQPTYGTFYCEANSSNCQDLGQITIRAERIRADQLEGSYYIEKGNKKVKKGTLKGRICQYTPRYCG